MNKAEGITLPDFKLHITKLYQSKQYGLALNRHNGTEQRASEEQRKLSTK